MRRALASVVAVATVASIATGCGPEPTTITSDEGEFTVEFPDKPRTRDDLDFDTFEFYNLYTDDISYNVSVVVASFPEPDQTIDLDLEVDGSIDQLGWNVISDESLDFQGRTARFVEYDGTTADPNERGIAHFMTDGPRQYDVMVSGPGELAEFRKFVDSFQFITDPMGNG